MMIIIITAIDLDQVGPQERVRHMNLMNLKITILIITPWAVANVKACGAKKSIGIFTRTQNYSITKHGPKGTRV